MATSALVAGIAMADTLLIKDTASQALAQINSDTIPVSNFNDSDFTAKPTLPEDFDFSSKADVKLSPLNMEAEFDLEQAYMSFDMRDSYLERKRDSTW